MQQLNTLRRRRRRRRRWRRFWTSGNFLVRYFRDAF